MAMKISGSYENDYWGGLYRMKQDEKGSPKITYDNPEKAAEQNRVQPAKEPSKNAEKTTINTDKVDREIRKRKEEKKQLEQQLMAAAGDEEKEKELEKKIAQIEKELKQKDNDTYRRLNAVIS